MLKTVPKLWDGTMEAHRQAVREAILEATAALVASRGLQHVTMSQIAEDTGIGRATLYKYFPDLDAILVAWHERQISAHLEQLSRLHDAGGSPAQRLEAVLEAYALSQHEHRDEASAALLHQGEHVDRAQQHLRRFIGGLVAEGAAAGELRDDVAPAELASYCLHALSAAAGLRSKAAVRRLVAVTLSGLRPGR